MKNVILQEVLHKKTNKEHKMVFLVLLLLGLLIESSILFCQDTFVYPYVWKMVGGQFGCFYHGETCNSWGDVRTEMKSEEDDLFIERRIRKVEACVVYDVKL